MKSELQLGGGYPPFEKKNSVQTKQVPAGTSKIPTGTSKVPTMAEVLNRRK